jgi:hypothetical protein
MVTSNRTPYVRIQASWLAGKERSLLLSIVSMLPAWVQPDHLTLLGLVGSLLCGIGFAASGISHWFLCLAVVGLALNWFGDSLDGSLARARLTERPKYGFFVDHTCDILSQAMIFMGLALSPYVRFETGCLLLMSYWLAAMFTFIRTISSQVFMISYYGIGPTEIRIGLILYAASLAILGPLPLMTPIGVVSAMDVVGVAIFAGVMTSFILMTYREARRLSALEAAPEAPVIALAMADSAPL